MTESEIIAIWVASWSWILVKWPVTSLETRNFLEKVAFLIWETKEKVSLEKKSLSTKGDYN